MTDAYFDGMTEGVRRGEESMLRASWDHISPSIILERFIDGRQDLIPDRFKLVDKAA